MPNPCYAPDFDPQQAVDLNVSFSPNNWLNVQGVTPVDSVWAPYYGLTLKPAIGNPHVLNYLAEIGGCVQSRSTYNTASLLCGVGWGHSEVVEPGNNLFWYHSQTFSGTDSSSATYIRPFASINYSYHRELVRFSATVRLSYLHANELTESGRDYGHQDAWFIEPALTCKAPLQAARPNTQGDVWLTMQLGMPFAIDKTPITANGILALGLEFQIW